MFKITGNIIETDILTLKGLISDAIKIAKIESSSFISKSKAYELYGRRMVDKWLKAGLIKQYKDVGSSKIRISREELETIACANNRISY